MVEPELPKVEAILPHAPPMVVIDRILELGSGFVECAAVVRAAWWNGAPSAPTGSPCVPSWVTLEHMAQTVGVYAGLESRAAGEPVRVGFLLSARHLELHSSELRDGQELRVRADCEWQDGELGLFDCSVRDGATGELVAAGRLSVYRPRDASVVFARGRPSDRSD